MNCYLIGLTLLASTACGSSDAPPKPQNNGNSEPTTPHDSLGEEPEEPSGTVDWADSMGTATISGTVKFEGTPPVRKTINVTEAKCHGEGEGLLEETVIVNDGGLANVILSVSKGLDGYKFAKGTGTVTLNQEGCQFIPHVIVLQRGQSMSIENSDDAIHNVHFMESRNGPFNYPQPAGVDPLVKLMKRAEKSSFLIKCDMHEWMRCRAAVFDHPFFTVSDEKGNFTLPKLPAGTYSVTAEHELLGIQKVEATVADGGSLALTFSFKQ